MSSNQQIPPLVQEQLAKLQQTQQNLQSILAQKQQLEFDKLETEKALEELQKVNDDDMVFKHAGTILIKSNKKDLIEELDEKKELAKTKASLLTKQEERLKITLKEGETKIQEMIKNQSVAGTQQPQHDESRK
ncbi:MAG: prefoldin subunit beta [Thaumarchaeota archaeon]|jgi:prefoldin beta subunit|uniref:Prefoldin subunit beta n=1 Tax=marine metagenome TaxID=408172 RepID=A0A381UNA5_9ZZZZ|nr:MAG: prefoldin subunit beta [Nitrososphaerota archaeon]RZD35214.1 MAG: prefoldin subunit beta [Nitrososphaerota archaeon]HIA25803.1 prefoldin subunit beta [Candidatus Nitrosopelagicus sp.]HIF53137.1 prefoldin subunit beta [Candidatus Nitrosopelagicus sp.]HIO32257.1 prefoldin subunit beta [Candidatus Nitrosopelagicus sp.]|tara:strand:+ start:379 stop:777 length:399 start_codon:yes stop_codon:yes gene_type:complete